MKRSAHHHHLQQQHHRSMSSSSLSTTVFERFSAQFDKQYGRPRCPPPPLEHGSSNKFTDDAPTIIVDMLTRDRQTQKPIEIRQQEFSRSLKAREMHIDSTKQYNREQDQFCHGVGVPYKLAELDHEEDRDSSGKIFKSSVVYYILCMYLCIHILCMYVCMYSAYSYATSDV